MGFSLCRGGAVVNAIFLQRPAHGSGIGPVQNPAPFFHRVGAVAGRSHPEMPVSSTSHLVQDSLTGPAWVFYKQQKHCKSCQNLSPSQGGSGRAVWDGPSCVLHLLHPQQHPRTGNPWFLGPRHASKVKSILSESRELGLSPCHLLHGEPGAAQTAWTCLCPTLLAALWSKCCLCPIWGSCFHISREKPK